MPTKKKATGKASKSLFTLMDPSIPLEHRKRMLMHLCIEAEPLADEMLGSLLDAAAAGNSEGLKDQKLKELTELIDELQKGPLRSAMFDRLLNRSGSVCRARLLLDDGGTAYCVVPDAKLASMLRCGDTVLIESQGKAVLDVDPLGNGGTGEKARLERWVDDDHVEVTLRDIEGHVYRASATLIEKRQQDGAEPGCQLLVHPRREMALDVVPAPDGLSHYRFLVREPVPDVVVERDIGCPPAFIEDLADQIRAEMVPAERDRRRRYRLRRSQTKLLYGVSGSGKTLSVHAIWRRMYEVMSEVTGLPIEDLPPRVLKLRMPKVLSKWLGESDKRLNRFFDEVEQLADEKFVAPDGAQYELPILVIGEEADGLARARGEGDAVYDRIQTTALERLDTNYGRLKDQLIVFLFTTNVPQLVDPAFLRRAGGTAEQFGRLNRRSFSSVLSKHVRDLPLRADCGEQPHAERQTVRQVTDWLFCPNGHDKGQVQLFYVGSSNADIKHRRDFLTGALVDRAVQQAATEACRVEQGGCDQPGLSAGLIIEAFDGQIRTIADQLTEHNAANYLTMPEGSRVGNVRRIEQPRMLPFQFERAS